MGSILNVTPPLLREDMLSALHDDAPEFADQVRKAIFTFAHVPSRIAPRDVPRILRDMDKVQLVIALAADDPASRATTEWLLQNVTQRMAETLREELSSRPRPSLRDSEQAQARLIGLIRTLESDGTIQLLAQD